MKTLKQFITEAVCKQEGLISEDLAPENGNFKYPPPFLTMKRRAVRAFPDGQHVATYYIAQLKKYISIPFDSNKHGGIDLPALGETLNPPADRSWERKLGTEHEPANDPKVLHLPKVTPKMHPADFDAKDYHNIIAHQKHSLRMKPRFQDNKPVAEEVIEEAAKPKKKAKVKPKPYDFFKHLKDIAKGGEDKNKPLRFNSGERMRMQPEMANLIIKAHGKLNPMNQAKAERAMRKGKKTFRLFHTYALGVATVTK